MEFVIKTIRLPTDDLQRLSEGLKDGLLLELRTMNPNT